MKDLPEMVAPKMLTKLKMLNPVSIFILMIPTVKSADSVKMLTCSYPREGEHLHQSGSSSV